MNVSNPKSNFFDDNFQKLAHIGRGGFGEVYHVRHMIEGEEYAVKVVKFLDIYGDHKRQEILKEVQNLVKLRSDFVVNYRNSWREDNHLYIQMDYYPQNLQTIIDNKHIVFGRQTGELMKIFEYFISCEIIRELLESVKYLHDLCPPVIHRDLKPSNVLISQNSNNSRFIRLCDLGLATSHDMTSMSHTSNVGTAQYMAPEIFQPRYTIKVDIYSLAVIAFHLFDLFNIENPIEKYKSTAFSTTGRPVVEYSTTTTSGQVENVSRNEGMEGKVSVGEEGNTPQERHKREERNQSHVSIGVTLGHKSRDIQSDRTDQLSTRVMSSSAAGGDKPSVSKGNASKLRTKFESMAQNEKMVSKRRADEERDRRLEREKHKKKAEKEIQQVVTKAAVNPESDAEKQNLNFVKTAKPSNNSDSLTGLTATALYDYKAADLDDISFHTNELVTDIEMIDEGCCRGRCGNRMGLFPVNYVQFNQMTESEITDKDNDIAIASIVGNSLAIDPKYKSIDNEVDINCIQLFHGFDDNKGFNVLFAKNDGMVYGMGSNQWGRLVVVIITHLWSPVMTVSTDGVIIVMDSWVVGNSNQIK
ncbi:unnamed protein product [Medioppia subpectinata]|uniref:Protein kinase domain-containing protein n=1 Tax=Medioppia subpectinata TaxID=1979941 RepID=A0A7R9KJF6_9ACAR|nr:unnamed protein product [Medioppia subpectinata]CAG2103292.1 unnamed protein product [Medioppia subpectinata]